MSSLSFWLALSRPFLEGFAFASVIAGVVYWVWRLQSPSVQVVAGLCAVLVTFCFVGLFFIACFVDIKVALMALLTVLVFSVGQALFEYGADAQTRSTGYHCTRTVISYLCSAALGFLVLVGLIVMQIDPSRPAFSSYGDFGVAALVAGYGVGFFFAPVSISFFRWAILSLRLRPGKDRALEEGDEGEFVGASR